MMCKYFRKAQIPFDKKKVIDIDAFGGCDVLEHRTIYFLLVYFQVMYYIRLVCPNIGIQAQLEDNYLVFNLRDEHKLK